MILTPTYHVLKMYSVHRDAKLIDISFTSPQYEMNGESIDQISVSASINDTNTLHVSLCNLHHSDETEVHFDVRGRDVNKVTETVHNPGSQYF